MLATWRLAIFAAAIVASVEAAAKEPWTYGEHPVLGLTAHIDIDGESIGLACAQTSVLRLTRGLVETIAPSHGYEAALAYYFEGAMDRGSVMLKPGSGGFFQAEGTACENSIDAFARGQAFVIVENQGRPPSGGERKAPIRFRIPLAGSAAAIKQLIKACPGVARDLRDACGIGH